MKTLLFAFSFLLVGFTSLAQEQFIKKNTVSLGINSPLFSISYDRIFLQKNMWKLSGQLHIAPLSFEKGFGGGLGLNAFRGKRNGHLQIGLDYTYWVVNPNESKKQKGFTNNLITPTIGYRYQRPAGGLFFSINAGPMFGFIDDSFFVPIPGGNLGLGFSF